MSDLATMKKCKGCGVEKERSEFYKHKHMKDGLLSKCKECSKKASVEWVKKNRQHRLEYMQEHRRKNADAIKAYESSPAYKASHKKATKKYERGNRHKQKAHRLVRIAIAEGRLSKPSACSKCPATENIHGHHDDYSKPLEVRWLCDKCHRKHHVEHRASIRALENSEL